MADNKSTSSNSMEDVHYDAGQYGFTVCAGKGVDYQGKSIPKNIHYTYSETLQSLFVKKGEKCPFEIGTAAAPPPGSEIKVNIYSQAPEKTGPVMLCPTHAQSDINDMCPLHFARSESEDASYLSCAKTGELWVSVPFKGPTNGMKDIQNLRFLCYSSCSKEKEKKFSYLYLKFSLVHSETVLGYRVLKLHVCSTPGRTRESREQAFLTGKRKPLPSKMRSGVSETFPLVLNSRKTYNILKKLNYLLELEEAIPVEIQQKYLKRHRIRMEAMHTVTHTVTSTSSAAPRDIPTTSSDLRYTYRRLIKRCRLCPHKSE